MSIGYGIWTGVGASGSVLLGIYLFKESKKYEKVGVRGGTRVEHYRFDGGLLIWLICYTIK
ncbi:SMR family transporter [Saccharibacillus deserti]|uniref:SMR family transporter n=1 Tax=Saccharibacillus deserti TaxID=1634444 RepID=UPI0034576D59